MPKTSTPLLENEVVPLYYDKDRDGLSRGWVMRMKNALLAAGAKFTAARMVREYTDRFYIPSMEGSLDGDDPPMRGSTQRPYPAPVQESHDQSSNVGKSQRDE